MSLLKLSSIDEIVSAKRIACYPAASGAFYFLNYLEREQPDIFKKVIALGDKDPRKQGKEFLNLIIAAPDELAAMDLDTVLVTTVQHFSEIESELKNFLSANCKIIDVNIFAEYLDNISLKASALARAARIDMAEAELSSLLEPVSPTYLCLPLGSNRYTKNEKGSFTFHLLEHISLPQDLSGKRVLDVGASDCFYSFECEARGAAEVVAIDKLAWSNPKVLRRVQLMKDLYGSRVQQKLLNVEDLVDSNETPFDVVLALGLYYHVRDPYLMFRTLRRLTRERLIVSGRTLGVHFSNPLLNNGEDSPYMIFAHPEAGKWLANTKCLVEMLYSAGFPRVEVTFDLVPSGSIIGSTTLCAYVR